MTEYIYSPLSAGQIRLVRLYPAENQPDSISCHLEVTSLDSEAQFQALSYVWGSPIGTTPIRCGDGELLITPNLHIALRRLRRTQVDRVMWIDAVCINQQGVIERNEQVKLMRQIYAKASEVIIWLGEEPVQVTGMDEEPLTLSLAFTIAQHQIAKNAPIFAPTLDLPSLERELSRFENIPDLEPHTLQSLIAYPWFSRMWIIQEAAVNERATVVCGNDHIPWGEFQRVVETASRIIESQLRHVEMKNIKRCQALVSVKNILHDQ